MSETATVTPIKPKAGYKLHPTLFKEAGAMRNPWHVTPPAGVPLERVLEPDFWGHINRLQIGDHIEVVAEDGAYWAWLLTRNVGKQFAKVEVIIKKDPLDALPDQASASDDFEEKYAGPHHKWRVERIKDGAVMKTGFETRELAALWRMQNARSLAA